jgi:hypothetical protein
MKGVVMKTGFVRCLWGIDNPGTARQQLNSEIDFALTQTKKFPHTFTTFVYGKDNYTFLKRKGLDVVLAGEDSDSWPDLKDKYRPKIDLIRYAMGEGGFDEIVFLDWDCYPTSATPDDFWEETRKKGKMQMNLMRIRRIPFLPWRNNGREFRSISGFMYLADKTIPVRAIEAWETLPDKSRWSDDNAWRIVQDEVMGGWKGIDAYYETCEPKFCNVKKSRVPYSMEQMAQKQQCFYHEWSTPPRPK